MIDKTATTHSTMKLTIRPIVVTLLLIPSLLGNIVAQTLTYVSTEFDGVGGVDGLDGTYGVAISNDGNHLYTASSTDDAVVVFSINTSNGALTFVESHIDDGQGGAIDGLKDAKRLVVSPDGNNVYVPSSNDDAIVVFSRDPATGELTYVETIKDGVGGVDGLNGAFAVAVSSDDQHLYAVGSTDDAIAVFKRNPITGSLSFVEVQFDGVASVDGLNGAHGVKVSPDGKHVYVASATDDAVAVFKRNTTTGALTYSSLVEDGVGGVDGLNGAYDLFISPDNNHVYVASSNDDAIAVFSRNTSTGALTYVEMQQDDSQGGAINGLNAARSVVGSSDGNMIYAVASSDDALLAFVRDPATGTLTYDATYFDGVGGVDGLDGVRLAAITPDDNFIYTVSTGDDGLSSFTSGGILSIELGSNETEWQDTLAGNTFEEEVYEISMTVFPNPCPSGCQLQFSGLEEDADLSVSIYNTAGQLIAPLQANSNNFSPTMTVPNTLENGMYIIHAVVNNNQVVTQKLVVNK